jgi:hypothetical protein
MLSRKGTIRLDVFGVSKAKVTCPPPRDLYLGRLDLSNAVTLGGFVSPPGPVLCPALDTSGTQVSK